MSTQTTGLFLATYFIGNEAIGAVSATLKATVDTPRKLLNGKAQIFQATSPPASLVSYVQGSYKNEGLMHVFTAEGFPIEQGGPTGPVVGANFRLAMTLEEDFQSGTGEFLYLTPSGEWKSSGKVPVTSSPIPD